MSRPGDWNCWSCQHLNFQRRDTCQRCGCPKYSDFSALGVGRVFGLSATGSEIRPGDWYCTVGNCGTHNFASRSTCFNCGVVRNCDSSDLFRARSSRGMNRSSWKSGDWICTRWGCSEHNFASRTECFKCSAPRDIGSRSTM